MRAFWRWTLGTEHNEWHDNSVVPGDSNFFVYTDGGAVVYLPASGCEWPLRYWFSWPARYGLKTPVDSTRISISQEMVYKNWPLRFQWAIRHQSNVSIRCHLCLSCYYIRERRLVTFFLAAWARSELNWIPINETPTVQIDLPHLIEVTQNLIVELLNFFWSGRYGYNQRLQHSLYRKRLIANCRRWT